MAPPATERAAFEKNCRADSGSIVDGVVFDIENNAFLHDFSGAAAGQKRACEGFSCEGSRLR
jgi:hypothetical protein